MKATHIFTPLFLLAAIATSCDNIAEDDRYIKVEKPEVQNPRNLLIMEFTGNNCSNCPTGAATIELIKEDEPGRVISVGLHPDGSTFTTPVVSLHTATRRQDFRSEAATAIFDYYGKPDAFPCAIFNGTEMSASISAWTTKATDALKLSAPVNISATSQYEEVTRQLTVDYSVEFINTVTSKINATVWLVENDILGTQTMPSGSKDLNYVHNHVLRTSLNGNWGEEIGAGFDSDSQPVGKTTSITLQEDWVATNCQLVIFVYDDSTKEVLQAIQIPAVPAAEE
ncbi:MAG: Omp28 family outer membrane lipoprotein [Muribaculaceae bacterium]|nr:Omp28 family outer membrane lipoprotein [Muribaculaceae bacterium]